MAKSDDLRTEYHLTKPESRWVNGTSWYFKIGIDAVNEVQAKTSDSAVHEMHVVSQALVRQTLSPMSFRQLENEDEDRML